MKELLFIALLLPVSSSGKITHEEITERVDDGQKSIETT